MHSFIYWTLFNVLYLVSFFFVLFGAKANTTVASIKEEHNIYLSAAALIVNIIITIFVFNCLSTSLLTPCIIVPAQFIVTAYYLKLCGFTYDSNFTAFRDLIALIKEHKASKELK